MTRLIALAFALTLASSLQAMPTRTPPAAGRDGHYCPRSMWSWYAHGERHLRGRRSPRRQQVRPRSDLLVGRFGWQYDAAKLGLPFL